MIMPGVQKPHCSAWCSWKACCTGCSAPSAARPSIVVTSCPSAWTASTEHDFTLRPSRCDRARAAVAGVASDHRADLAELLPQVVHEQRAGFDVVVVRTPSTVTLIRVIAPSSSDRWDARRCSRAVTPTSYQIVPIKPRSGKVSRGR